MLNVEPRAIVFWEGRILEVVLHRAAERIVLVVTVVFRVVVVRHQKVQSVSHQS